MMRALINNLVGGTVAVFIAAAIFGAQLENALFPIIVGPQIKLPVTGVVSYLPEPVVSNVRWVGKGADARLFWSVDFCKQPPNAVLEGAGYTFYLIRSPERPGLPISVRNETRGAPVGTTPFPSRCLKIEYSSRLPGPEDDETQPIPERGDFIISTLTYKSRWGWWTIQEDFGVVTVQDQRP